MEEVRKGLKILATSDLHGHWDGFAQALAATPCELVVVAGDLNDMDGLHPIKALETWRRFFALCGQYPAKTFLVVPGNHDLVTWLFAKGMKAANVHMVDGKTVYIKGWKFAGGYTFDGNASVDGADVYIYHKKPLSAGKHGIRPVLDPQGAKLVIWGHEHCDSLPPCTVHGATCVNVSSLLPYGGRYAYREITFSPAGATVETRIV